MQQIAHRLGLGVIGGLAGLAVMNLVRLGTAPLVKPRAPRPTDVFLTERTISPIGPHHRSGEPAAEALGRLAYEKLIGGEPSRRVQRALAWAVQLGYGLLAAAAYGLVRSRRTRRPVRDGAWFGAGLWLVGEEIAAPLLGLTDKPTAYHPTYHLQSLAQHLGFGIATAATTHALEEMR